MFLNCMAGLGIVSFGLLIMFAIVMTVRFCEWLKNMRDDVDRLLDIPHNQRRL